MPTKTGYKKLLLKAKELMGQAGLNAYERAKVLVDVFNDRDFRADIGNANDFKAAEYLDDYCGDLSVKFLRLKQLVEHFPSKEKWASGDLAQMVVDMEQAKRKEEHDAKPERHITRIKKQDFDEAVRAKDHAESRVRHVSEMLETAEQKIKRLETENADLRRQLAIAEGRLTELERILDREAIAA